MKQRLVKKYGKHCKHWSTIRKLNKKKKRLVKNETNISQRLAKKRRQGLVKAIKILTIMQI